MAILGRMLFHAAKRLGADPRVRAKAAQLFDGEVKPRVEAAWRRTKPKLDAAKAELSAIAHETDPREQPRAFVAKVKKRIVNRKKRR